MLTPGDRESPLWQRLKQYYQDRLIRFRLSNDGKMDPSDRDFLRGQIYEVKALLDLEEDEQVVSFKRMEDL